MAGLLARLFELAVKRADLKVTEVDDIDSWGFLLFRDGRYNIFINRSVRDFRKTMALADELGHYALRRRIARREGLPVVVRDAIARMRAHGVWVSDRLVAAALRVDEE